MRGAEINDSSDDKNENRRVIRQFQVLFVIFSALMIATGVIGYNVASKQLREQLVLKCQALAATVAAVIEEDSDGYAAFLGDMDMETDYYKSTKTLMMKLKRINVEHVTYIYTTSRAGENTIMYIIGGEDPTSPVYTAPGVTDKITRAERIAYSEQKPVLGENFENTTYGRRLSAYEPIIHKETGEFLGLVGADIISEQFNSVMVVFIIQSVATLAACIIIFAVTIRWLSGNVNLIISNQRKENTMLENLNRMKSEFFANLNHEMRTPLTIIATDIELAEQFADEGNIDGAKELLQEAWHETMETANRVTDALVFARGQEESKPMESIDFGAVIETTLAVFEPLIKKHGNTLTREIAKLPWVNGNADMLASALVNLLTNANNHTSGGIIHVTWDAEKGICRLMVRDNGSGISPELLPHVFERGVTNGNGTGLGLVIVKNIAELHGGEVAIESEEGKGTAVTFIFPIGTEDFDKQSRSSQ